VTENHDEFAGQDVIIDKGIVVLIGGFPFKLKDDAKVEIVSSESEEAKEAVEGVRRYHSIEA
jgi:hypothetical protein